MLGHVGIGARDRHKLWRVSGAHHPRTVAVRGLKKRGGRVVRSDPVYAASVS